MDEAVPFPPQVPQRRIDLLLADYAAKHGGLANRILQALALPLIVWSLLALLSRVPFPASLRLVPGLDWAAVAALGVIAGYVGLSWQIAVGLGAFSVLSLLIAVAYSRWGELPIWQLAITTLLLGWGLHFLGRRLDGRPFALVEDLRSLLIGPAWLLSLLYRLLGLRY